MQYVLLYTEKELEVVVNHKLAMSNKLFFFKILV